MDTVNIASGEIRVDQLKSAEPYFGFISSNITQLHKHRSPQSTWQCKSRKSWKGAISARVNENGVLPKAARGTN